MQSRRGRVTPTPPPLTIRDESWYDCGIEQLAKPCWQTVQFRLVPFCGQPSEQRFGGAAGGVVTSPTPGSSTSVEAFQWEIKVCLPGGSAASHFFLRCAMNWILMILIEINRISARPVLAEIDGRPTRIELERPEERPTRYIRPRR